jgi:hypothetical protein
MPKIEQDAGISVERYVAQDLGELAGGELARSTCAADHLGQPLRSGGAHAVLVLHVSFLAPRPGVPCRDECAAGVNLQNSQLGYSARNVTRSGR